MDKETQVIFDNWNQVKKEIQKVESLKITFSEREIWWCALGKNIGDEQDGKNALFERPVLVLRKFSKQSAIIVPLTTKGKTDSPFYYKLQFDENSSVILSQIRLTSSKRFLRKMYRLGRGEFKVIKSRIQELIF